MIYSTEEIVRSYREAKNPKKQIRVLADLNACTVKEIRQVLVGEGVLPRETETPEKTKSAPPKRFDEAVARVLYEEGADDEVIAKAVGVKAHTVAKWRSTNGLRKKGRKTRAEKIKDTQGAETQDVRKIPIVGEAVEPEGFTEAPKQRAVTVEELRSLLEDACKAGLGDCEVLVEKSALSDLWLEVHTTMHIYESGKRTVELKGTAKGA